MEKFEEKLIAAVRENEVLYNKSKEGYKNAQQKAEIWRKIAVQLQSTDETCIKRWRSLRDRFVRESRRLSAPSGSARMDYPTWELYEGLTFLKDHLLPRKTCGTHREHDSSGGNNSPFLSVNDSSYSELDVFSQESSSSQAKSSYTPTPKKRKTDSTADLTGLFQSAVDAFKSACKPETDTAMQTFMRAMASKLDNLPPILQNNAVLKISEYVVKLENVHMGLSDEMPESV